MIVSNGDTLEDIGSKSMIRTDSFIEDEVRKVRVSNEIQRSIPQSPEEDDAKNVKGNGVIPIKVFKRFLIWNIYNIINFQNYHLPLYWIEEDSCTDKKGGEKCEKIKNKGWCTNTRYAERAIKACFKTCTRCERQLPLNKPPPKKIAGELIDDLFSIRFEILLRIDWAHLILSLIF